MMRGPAIGPERNPIDGKAMAGDSKVIPMSVQSDRIVTMSDAAAAAQAPGVAARKNAFPVATMKATMKVTTMKVTTMKVSVGSTAADLVQIQIKWSRSMAWVLWTFCNGNFYHSLTSPGAGCSVRTTLSQLSNRRGSKASFN